MSRLSRNKRYFEDAGRITSEVESEISKGLYLLSKIKQPIVTIFGSHRATKDNPFWGHAHQAAKQLGRDGYAIMTGGGSGFQYAANLGAKEVGATSIGLQAALLKKEVIDDLVFTDAFSFQFLFARRFLLAIKSEALIFYPGGYGTLNEFFEYLTLIQTGIVDRVPIICVGKEFWSGLVAWLRDKPLALEYFTHTTDPDLITIVEEVDQAIALVKES